MKMKEPRQRKPELARLPLFFFVYHPGVPPMGWFLCCLLASAVPGITGNDEGFSRSVFVLLTPLSASRSRFGLLLEGVQPPKTRPSNSDKNYNKPAFFVKQFLILFVKFIKYVVK